jgi:hypothetical protein
MWVPRRLTTLWAYIFHLSYSEKRNIRISKYYNVAHLLIARTVEPEKQPLVANGSETFVSRKRLGKHVPAAMDTHATIEILLDMVFFL